MWKIGCRNKSRHLCVGLASGEDQISLCVPWLRKRPLALRVGPLCSTFTWTLIQLPFQSASRGLQNQYQVILHHITPNSACIFNFQLQPCLKCLSKLEGFIGIPDSKVWFFNNFYFSVPSTNIYVPGYFLWIKWWTRETASLALESFWSSKGMQTLCYK